MEEAFKKLELEDLGWNKHFQMLIKRSKIHSSEVGDAIPNKSLNRYMDVKPYDRTRVKLSRTKDTDYINANLVIVPKAARQYILTQGPLPETLSHFWLMIWEQKSNVIVMLNRIVEMEEYVKCEQYWPLYTDFPERYEDVKLTVALKSVDIKKHYTIREMLLKDDESGKTRCITQFHYTAWPDHGEPDSPTSFLRLLAAVRKSGGLDKMDEPTIVHCSAGIGRSGTFCLIDSVLSMVENQGSTEGIDIVSTLLEMREYRMGLIQSSVQLRFAYMSIIYGIKILEGANKLHPHISSIMDSTALDSQQKRLNGSLQNNGKKAPRRNKKKQNSSNSNSSSLNIFKKHFLVEALDDVDSDTADQIFYDTMKPWPNIKKARNSSPEDLIEEQLKADIVTIGSNGPQTNQQAANDATGQQSKAPEAASKAQLLTNAINSLLTENTISTTSNTNASSKNPLLPNTSSVSQSTDSVLLRRRERDLQKQKLANSVLDIKNRMKAEELKRERMAFLKRSAVYGQNDESSKNLHRNLRNLRRQNQVSDLPPTSIVLRVLPNK